MDYEIQNEVDYIVEDVANFQYSRESGVNKVKQAVKSVGKTDSKTIREAVKYYEQQCDARGI